MLEDLKSGPPLGLAEASCVDHFLSDPAFWMLKTSAGEVTKKSQQSALVAGFLADCTDFTTAATNSSCQAHAKAIETGEPGPADPTDLKCGRRLDLGEDAETFARSLGQVRTLTKANQEKKAETE